MIDSTRMTWKGWLTMGLFSALSALVGCDRVATGELQPGQSTVADMKLKMGEPAAVYREGDREVWEYPLGPEGVRTYMMTVNAQGTLERIDQVLTEANFKRIQPGMTITEVRRILGRNSKEQRYGMTPGELTHKYKFNNGSEDQYFDVTYTADGRVKETGYDTFSLQRGSAR
ncbi:MAG: hypothetical protein JNL19_05375 [Burkholderiales bacterium]|nr:hypothetical protein [Burkholderiales bacterium]